MTRSDTESLLKYMMSMYPNVKMTDQQFINMVTIWAKELSNETRENVVAAFRLARTEYPDWMPTLPKIQQSLNILSAKIQLKSPEQEFRDSHCGKSREEWEQLLDWEKSSDGAEKLKSYREHFARIIGGLV